MPALAVTEHGNMFSSVVFHDHARKRGIKPILGCEVYVAPGEPLRQERARRARPQPPGAAGRERRRASRTSSSWCRPATPKASTTSRASTRSCSRSTPKGLIGLSSCLKGEVASALRVEQAKPALEAAAPAIATSSAPDNFFLEMQYQGIEEQKIVNTRPAADRARARTCRSSRTNDVHYLRQGDHQPHDILLCIGTGKTVNDAQRLRITAISSS